MAIKEKRRGVGVEIRTFRGRNHAVYLVLRTTKGSYHVFKEVEAKDAARRCGAKGNGNTRQLWAELWKGTDSA